MGTEYLGLHAIGWHGMLKTWWDKVLAVLLLTTIVLGCLYILFIIGKKLHARWKGRRQLSTAPAAVTRYLDRLKRETKPLRSRNSAKLELKTFGVYLGSIPSPPSSEQLSILSQWDVIVVDPLQHGLLSGIYNYCSAAHVLGRLHVPSLINIETSITIDEVIQGLCVVAQTVISNFTHPQARESPFHGVLLADWRKHFQPVVLNQLVQYLNGIGLDVWLEMSPSDYLSERECRDIDGSRIRGIVYRNGTIFPNGNQRDYFQMEKMRTVMRVVAAQKAMGGCTHAMWETVEDDVDVSHHVLGRTFKWCAYNSAMTWIGPWSALTDANVAARRTVKNEPLGALMWLKEDVVLKTHDNWRFNDKVTAVSAKHAARFEGLRTFVPDILEKMTVVPPAHRSLVDTRAIHIDAVDWSSKMDYAHMNPFSVSPDGVDYTGLGCFQMGHDCSEKDISDLLEAQRSIRDLDLLDRIQVEELRRMAADLRALLRSQKASIRAGAMSATIQELIDLLSSGNGAENDRLRIWVGLHSGFRTRSETQVWGMYEADALTGSLDIFISGKTVDRTGTILHTFLSRRNFSRYECFKAEIALADARNTLSPKWDLPPRLVNDIEDLSPAEALLWMQRLTLSTCKESSALVAKVRTCCEYQLLEVPTLSQLRAMASTGYLSGKVSAKQLVEGRLAWYQSQGCASLEPRSALALFQEIDARLPGVLIKADSTSLAKITEVMEAILRPGQIDIRADFLALSVFCAFRKLAMDEIYLEVLDRNPRPNLHHVQTSCFAENYAVGARCDAYIDMTPKAIGRILSDRIRAYYHQHQPPRREEAFTELPTAYASMDIDLDPNGGQEDLPLSYRFTFLGIFAVPALIDITLLTTIGRGLYLTTFMSNDEKTLATTALMVALLLCGGFGGWISSGGSYYLYAMAFPAMSMFVLTRFIAGVAVVSVGGLFAFIGIGIAKGFVSGVVFTAYLVMLTIYLMTLSALSIYQLPGFQFQSGRTVIMSCIPILFVSPVLTIWLQHDIIIYPCVLAVFLTVLLLGARRVIAKWNNWYLHIPCITDEEVVDWYQRTYLASASTDDADKELASTALARQTLLACVQKERKRWFWTRSTADPFVKRLAEGYSATMFLLVWYCKFSRTKLPLAYSPTWNLQLKAAVDTMGDMQKGLKLHNAFLHWRHTGKDVWGGILYFIIALMDKWTALFTGEGLVGLSSASSETYRLAVGFGLCYYLIGAVILDGVSQPLWTLAHQRTPQPIPSLEFLREATRNDARARRALYWLNLLKFSFLHIWAVAVTCALVWSFEGSRSATIMYLAYVGAYTGLLWYQYNRIYTGSRSDRALTAGATGGFVACILLRVLPREFAYSGVIGLAVGTWTTAIVSFFRADVAWTRGQKLTSLDKDTHAVTYTCSTLEPDPDFSQSTLSNTFEAIRALPSELRYKLDPSQHPGAEVMQILLRSKSEATTPPSLQQAFPQSETILHRTAELCQSGETVVELVSARHLMLPPQDPTMRAITQRAGDRLHIFILISLDLVGDEWVVNIRRNCQAIAETLVYVTAESRLGLSRDHAMLAQLLAAQHHDSGTLAVPEGIKRQLESSPPERKRVIAHAQKTMLRHLLLGMDPDREWDLMPRHVHAFLIERACGQPTRLSGPDVEWIRCRPGTADAVELHCLLARSSLSTSLAVLVGQYAGAIAAHDEDFGPRSDFRDSSYDRLITTVSSEIELKNKGFAEFMRVAVIRFLQKIRTCIKFTVLSLVADPEYQRELNYILRGQSLVISWPITWILTAVWAFCKALQDLILPLVLLHGRDKVSTLYKNMKGQKTVLEKNRIVLESLNGLTTCFMHVEPDGCSRLYQYSGRHEQEPSQRQNLVAINTYTDKLTLRSREEYDGKGALRNEFVYDYPEASNTKLPMQRQCLAGELEGQVVQYDQRGYITTGSAMRGVNPVQFQYWYRKNAKFDDELLRAEYVFPHIKIKVAWSMPPRTRPERLDKWIPYPRVTEAVFIQDGDVYNAQWTYDHKFHPIIATTLNGEHIPTPPMICDDWFHVLDKPTGCTLLHDNPLVSFSSTKTNIIARLMRLNVKQYPIPTSRARTHLWKSWKASKEFDAVTTRWLDEILLRSDRILRPYWRRRDWGRLESAADYLDAQVDTILARVDIDPEISSWTQLAFKISDLYSFGQGGDARINTRTLSTQLQDTDSELHVLAMDTGTWPNEPGGVSACRRDMVNDLKHIRWHILAEAANDFGVPRFQIERNVQSLTVLPQWGLDFLNPTHGVFQNCLDSAVVEKSYDTTVADIRRNFLPILSSIVRCSRTDQLTRSHIEEATRALVDLNTYFESSRSWNDVWMSDTVKQAWREMWLSEDTPGAVPVSQWLESEKPTLLQLDTALDMWHRYLFIFSIPVPEKIPDVFQVSHHFTGATYGVLCKVKRQCALHVWDHCVSFREMTTFLSSAVSFDSTFVNTTLIGLGHLSCVLIQHHADVVLPCAEYFNPGWEIELGTCEGALQHRRTFRRKIDPVVNGITNMDKYKPIETIKTATPTVVMLSHIRYVKDIKTAIMATDLIVNIWGFRDYRLHIYGDMERAPAYASECQEIIASKGLREHVVLKGLGNPSVVLQDAWLFMNSSISEGLPLAMGEAALTGVPVVCTDVGASFCVVTDRATGKKFSEVVAPNDAISLASAQIRVLALLGQWSAFAEDEEGYVPPTLSLHPSREEVEQIKRRMYDKAEQRRKLGMLGRSNVYNNFSSDRYLREHEQMLWLGKYQSRSYVARGPGSSSNSSGFFKEKWKSSILIEQDEMLLTPNSDTWWAPFRPRLMRGSRLGGTVEGSSGTQTPV
ncbi:hypothetical protein LV164_000399 [Aspergillus fumigatus]|nr:hypothetical protein KXV47_004610 [Aspergillus fumigatus]KAH3146966.1 hypothetical protein KXW18_006046 [Aspergillus fumigatus]KAJ8218532.1 hypothetical protein LV164_000399 [Aspergillus fumigatus]